MSGYAPRAGDELPVLAVRTDTGQVFRYSAVTWNGHRIHFDHDYALAEGYEGVLVQSHLHGAFLTRACTDWLGPSGRLLSMSYRITSPAVAGELLNIHGTVRDIEVAAPGSWRAIIDLEERDDAGRICAGGEAQVERKAAMNGSPVPDGA